MSTNIDYDDINESGPIRRFLATSVDIFVVFLIRIIVAQLMMVTYLSARLKILSEDYVNFFGNEIIDTPDKAQFIFTHAVFSDVIIFAFILLFVGSLYYAFFNSSKFHATIGKRLLNIEIVNSDYSKLSFFKALLIYYVSLTPLLFMTHVFIYSNKNELGILQGMFDNVYNIIITVIIILLSGTYTAGFRRQPGFDIFLKVVLLNNKSSAKMPWEK